MHASDAALASTSRKAHTADLSYEGVCESQQPDAGKAVRDLLDRIASKWALLVIYTLNQSTLRYSALRERIPGISQRMLTMTLRNLERDGLISRTVYGEVPPRVEYSLTPLGETLIEPANALANWAILNHSTIERAREQYDSAPR